MKLHERIWNPNLRGEPELNWLHRDQVDDNIQQYIIGHLWKRIMLLETQLVEVAHSLVRGGPFDRTASLSAMKFNLVELCVDLRTCDPHFCLRRLAPRFKARFNRVSGNRYGSSSAAYSDLLGDANMIRGYRTSGEFYKAYEKTNRRVRLECTITTPALSRRQDGRVFRDEDDFRTILTAMSAQVAPEFNYILRDERSEFDDHGSPAELISLLNPILRRHQPTAVQRVYEALMRHGRLTPSELSGASLKRLVQAGVLRHSARGIYIIAPRYARALRAFGAVDRRWQSQVMTQDPLPVSGARRIVHPLPVRERPRTRLRRVVPRRPQQTFANSDRL